MDRPGQSSKFAPRPRLARSEQSVMLKVGPLMGRVRKNSIPGLSGTRHAIVGDAAHNAADQHTIVAIPKFDPRAILARQSRPISQPCKLSLDFPCAAFFFGGIVGFKVRHSFASNHSVS